jgi:hypothetical protein
MKWLLMLLAFVLGAAITWFLTVKRATRTVSVGDGAPVVAAAEPELTPVVSPGEPVTGAIGVAGGADLAAAAGAGVMAAEERKAAETAETVETDLDEDGEEGEDDASRFGGSHTEPSEAPGAAEGWDRDAQDEDALMPASAVEASDRGAQAQEDVPPVVDATPKGDLAGVGNPSDVAEVDGHVEAQQPQTGAETGESSSAGDVAGVRDSPARHEQGELIFDDEAEPTTTKPKNERGATGV